MSIYQLAPLTRDAMRRSPRPGPQMRRYQHIDRVGAEIDRSGPIRDGEAVRVPVMLIDGSAPSALELTPAQRAHAAAMCDRAVAEQQLGGTFQLDSAPRQAVADAAAEMHDYLSTAWAGVNRRVSSPRPKQPSPLAWKPPSMTDAAAGRAAADRVVALQEMDDHLSHAWRGTAA